MNKKHLFWIIPTGILLLLITFYLLTPVIAKSIIRNKAHHFATERNAELSIEGLHVGFPDLHGNIHISFKNAQLRKQGATDTLLHLAQMKATIQVLKGFHLTQNLTDLTCDTASIHLIYNHSYKNYDFLLGHSSNNEKADVSKDYKKLSQHIIHRINDLLPNTMKIGLLAVTTDFDGRHFAYTLPDFIIEKGRLRGMLTEESEGGLHRWSLDGALAPTDGNYLLSITDLDGNDGFSILNGWHGAAFGFHKLIGHLSITGADDHTNFYTLEVEADSVRLSHRYLATHQVTIDSATARLHLTVSPTRITIDSSSVLKLNDADLHPFFAYEKTGATKPHITLKINEEHRDAQQLLASVPDGLLQVLPDLQLCGRMDFSLLFDCDFNEVDSLDFDFSIGSRDHSISGDMGLITRFNAPFDYAFFINSDTIRSVTIGPANPHFCPFDRIPPYLTKSILATEDAGFFRHRGFIKSSIREALIADIKAGKLRRGGSTMTMQLVKNLFLNRNKVFSRKFEEMVLVWLIEDYQLISKERMFEIYVNIAEWGPDICGIGEASEFYFGKKPQELTLGECLYLASLIRAPKHYRSTLDNYGNVIDSKREELIFVARRMVEREFITEEELNQFNSFIHTKCMEKEEE